MIESLEVHGFRGLKHIELQGPKRFNFIVGPNSSGKSSVLESIFTFCAPLSFEKIIALVGMRHGAITQFSADQLPNFMKWIYSFPNDSSKYFYKVCGWADGNYRETSVELKTYGQSSLLPWDDNKFDSDINMDTTSTTLVSDSMKSKAFAEVIMKFEKNKQVSEQRYAFSLKGPTELDKPNVQTDLPCSAIWPGMHKSSELETSAYSKAVQNGMDGDILKFVSEIDQDIKDIRILEATDRNYTLFVDHKYLGLTPIANLGEGVRRLFLMAHTFAKCQHGVLLIDEIEAALHVGALEKYASWMTRAARTADVQIFATTHSLECIDAMLSSFGQDRAHELALFVLSKEKGEVRCKTIEGEDLMEIRNKLGQEVRW